MRKYQQLLLLVISCISIGILLMYKTENNRLKDVLHVINFFGRSDAALLKRLENNASTVNIQDYSHPLGVWQALSDNFHSYSTYWKRNELIAGGEVVAIVAGRKGAVLNFKCSLNYGVGVTQKQGKFRFQRLDKLGEDDLSEFTHYHFYCRVTRDFGQPESVTFTDLTGKGSLRKVGQALKLRNVKKVDKENKYLQPITVCLQLLDQEYRNMSSTKEQHHELLQFFTHHYTLGIEDFIVYNADELPRTILPALTHLNARLHLLPFNFPYSSANDMERVRNLIEADCLLRNTNRAHYTLLLAANEFFYPATKLDDDKSVLKALKHYTNEVTRFELPMFAVCKDQSHNFLMDNTLYDPEVHLKHKLFIYRLTNNMVMASSDDMTITPRSVILPKTNVFVHRYVSCARVGKDGLHDWRNSVREDFMQHLRGLKEEMKLFI